MGAYVVVQREVKEERARLMRESLEENDREKEESESSKLTEEDEDVIMSDD